MLGKVPHPVAKFMDAAHAPAPELDTAALIHTADVLDCSHTGELPGADHVRKNK